LAGLIQSVVSSGAALLVYALIVAGVYKLFQMAADVSEMKDLLRDIKRNTQDSSTPGQPPAAQPSPDDLLRALRAESYSPEAPAAPNIEPR
jgi:hypothetical protein